MIYTVTLNPALDYTADAASFFPGKTNRTQNEYVVPGGKGLNVSIILERLGDKTTSLGFYSGFTGHELIRLMEEMNCKCNFYEVEKGFTRINVKLKTSHGITEFNGSGIAISSEDTEKLKTKISSLKDGNWLVLSGSVPKGMPADIYKELAMTAPHGVKTVIDTSGIPLSSSLKAHPFLIKPNIDEIRELFKKPVETFEDISLYAARLKDMGARNVMVSMDSRGAVLFTEKGEIYSSLPPKGKVINTVGAGDSAVAGFIHKYSESENMEEALKFAVASGSATAYSPWLASAELICELYKKMKETH